MTKLAPLPERAAAVAPAMTWALDHGDFAVAALDDPVNPGGLVSDGALLGAVATLLFTDARGEVDPIDPTEVDLRGWPGDCFDIDVAGGEGPLGSQLWMLARRPVNAETARLAEVYAAAALRPLIAQKLIKAATFAAEPSRIDRRIVLTTTITRSDGARLYSGPLAGLWSGLKHEL